MIDTNRIYTPEQFAKLMKLSTEYVRQCCRRQKDFRTGAPVSLPDEWTAQKFGRSWMIYKIKTERKRSKPR